VSNGAQGAPYLFLSLLGACLLGMVSPAFAAPEKEKETSYDIEVLVFENNLPELIGEELFARDVKPLTARDLDKAVPPDSPLADSLLGVAAGQLSKDGHYRLLAQARWQQTLDPSGKAAVKPVRINAGKDDELDGTVRFYMSRFLHLDVQLLFREPGSSASTPLTYRISEQRRVKSQETHYFDHPKFGVLVRIMPVEKDKKS
jgi:hypothetical protein